MTETGDRRFLRYVMRKMLRERSITGTVGAIANAVSSGAARTV
jgi:hypothetical protein